MSVQNDSFQTKWYKRRSLEICDFNTILFSPFAREPNGQNVLTLYHPENKYVRIPTQHILPGTLAVLHVIRGVGKVGNHSIYLFYRQP